jgi:hypothetical protein
MNHQHHALSSFATTRPLPRGFTTSHTSAEPEHDDELLQEKNGSSNEKNMDEIKNDWKKVFTEELQRRGLEQPFPKGFSKQPWRMALLLHYWDRPDQAELFLRPIALSSKQEINAEFERRKLNNSKNQRQKFPARYRRERIAEMERKIPEALRERGASFGASTTEDKKKVKHVLCEHVYNELVSTTKP